MQEKNAIASVYFWTMCCILLTTRVSKSAHFTTSTKIAVLPFHVNLTYIFMQYY
jgi:hypothetical protein